MRNAEHTRNDVWNPYAERGASRRSVPPPRLVQESAPATAEARRAELDRRASRAAIDRLIRALPT